MPLQINAHLLAVHAAGDAGEAYDGPAAAGAQKWAGQADAYLREHRQRGADAAGGNVTLDRLLLVDHGNPAIEFTVGDVVTFQRLGIGTQETAVVDIVQRPNIEDPDIPGDLITVRLTLRAV
jgi:hypothetical protein